jgi:hypothetical protein
MNRILRNLQTSTLRDGDCEPILDSMKRELAIRRMSEPTAGEIFRFENPGVSDEYDPD